VSWAVSADGFRLPSAAEWEFACRADYKEAASGSGCAKGPPGRLDAAAKVSGQGSPTPRCY